MPIQVVRGRGTATRSHERSAFLVYIDADSPEHAGILATEALQGAGWYALHIDSAGPVAVEALNATGADHIRAYETALAGGVGVILYGDLAG